MQPQIINIFDRNFYRINLQKLVKSKQVSNFLIQETSENIKERLDEFSTKFTETLIYGLFDSNCFQSKHSKITRGFIIPELSDLDINVDQTVIYDEEFLPFPPNSFDLIISNLSLHLVNDLPGTLIQYKNALKPNGLFIATLFGPNTLKELRDAFIQTDIEFYNGAYPRVIPFIEIKDSARLLSRAGFTMPVSDSYTIEATYTSLLNLFRDIKDIGQNNCLLARNKLIPAKNYFNRVEQLYKERDSLKATFEIITITGTKA